ncbi:type II toxin-antitoxin system HigB family toxin [Candidatus Nitrotoga sp. M5]|uniref:type II toxin-antitoxin system HigB family toxin n=1 Tax=Candidatus Nitrotoga sp. M5 TaxID=2890409 RepID=UPI001EF2F325|nr:type II toxin-antitoxin system HigB family toxin [Candidatus Nitrotoga sp. M5]
MLHEFWRKHPGAERLLREWHSVVEHAEFRKCKHIREFFNSVENVPPYTIFDVGGNNYRLVVIVRYKFKKLFVHKVMAHRE